MFGKLMKYEMKSYLKIFLPFWIGLAVLSVLNGFTIRIMDSDRFDLGVITGFLTLSLYGVCIIAVAVISYIFVILRYWKGLLGREGYLMFTLPVSRDSLLSAKLLCAVCVKVVSFIVTGISVLLTVSLAGGKETSDAILNGFAELIRGIGSDGEASVLLVVQGVFLGLFSVAKGILKLYAAMSIGHLARKNKGLCAFAVYIGFGAAVRTGVAVLSTGRMFYDSVKSLALNTEFTAEASTTAGYLILVELLGIVLYGLITRLVTCRQLNLE